VPGHRVHLRASGDLAVHALPRDRSVLRRFYIKTRVRRLLHRAPPQNDADWADRDRAFARWYAPLLIIGYGFSLGTLAWAGIPSTVHFVSLIIDRFSESQNPTTGILDALSFITLTALQWGLVLYVTVRDRRARARQAAPQ
jgi:hypothetical protein